MSNDLPKPVLHSFDDFLELNKKLRTKIPEADIPRLPKIGFSFFNQAKFLEMRRDDLQLFLDKMSSQRYLATCPYYLDFICPDVSALISKDTGDVTAWKPLPNSEILLIYVPALPVALAAAAGKGDDVSRNIADAVALEQKAVAVLNDLRVKLFATKTPSETVALFAEFKDSLSTASKQTDDVIAKFASVASSSSNANSRAAQFLRDATAVAQSAKRFIALLARAEDYAVSSAAKIRHFRATRQLPVLAEWAAWYGREIDRLSSRILTGKRAKDELAALERALVNLKLEVQRDLITAAEGKQKELQEMFKGLAAEIDTVVEVLKKNDDVFYLDFKIGNFEKELGVILAEKEKKKKKEKSESESESDDVENRVAAFRERVDEFARILDTGVAEQNEAVRRINEEILAKIEAK